MRHLSDLGICLLLAGCGLAARQEREQQQAAADAAMQQGFESCKVQFVNRVQILDADPPA